MSISIWEGIKKYRATKAAEQSGVLSAHQGHKERRLALADTPRPEGRGFLSIIKF
jgi:hypothetical protein